jgi:5-hydroxyisourate hydrolase-like protein (transthyretin family)
MRAFLRTMLNVTRTFSPCAPRTGWKARVTFVSLFCLLLLGVAPASRPTHDLAGHLFDDEQHPLADVEIKLSYSDGIHWRAMSSVKTDAKGAFLFKSVSLSSARDARLMVLAIPNDRAIARAQVFSRKIGEPLELVSRRAKEVSGRVVLPDGSPAKDVAIHLWSLQRPQQPNDFGWWWFPEKDTVLDAKTDADGNFTIGHVPDDAKDVMLMSEQKGFAQIREHGPADTPFTIELKPEARITGRALFASDHKPAPRVKIYTQGADKSQSQETYTDDAGRYELTNLGADKYNIWIEAPNYTCVAIDSLQVSAGEKVEAPDLALVHGGFIKGKVIDQATNEPICPGDDADVAIYGPSRPESGAAVETSLIAKDGTFAIRCAPGMNRIYIRCGEGWTGVAPKEFRLNVEEGQTVSTDFTVRKMTDAEIERQKRGVIIDD